jgi:hypothetical protein
MLAFLSFIGILLLIAVVVAKVLPSAWTKNIAVLDKLSNPKVFFGVLGFAIFLSLFNWLFFVARQGHQYYLVYPTGGSSTVFSTGLKFRGFAVIQEWQKEIDIKTVADNEPTEGIEGVIRDKVQFQITVKGKPQILSESGIAITFLDRVHGAVKISIRMTMPADPKLFAAIAESFRSQENLINNTIIPTIREQLSNAGYQFAAQDYISGAATDFRQAVDDQLKFGGYSTERREFHDTVYTAIQENGPRTIKEINTRYKIIKNLDKNGNLIRIPHEITKKGLIVSQVIVDKVEPEPAFKQRLEAQRDISAQKRIEMEKIETAKATQQRVIAEGEVSKANERVTQETEQIKTLIGVETELKKEATRKQLAEIALQTETLNAQAVLVKERANAEASRLKVAAGLSPQERAQFDKETAIGVAQALAGPEGFTLPQVYIQGSGGKGDGNSIISDLLGAEIAKKMLHP